MTAYRCTVSADLDTVKIGRTGKAYPHTAVLVKTAVHKVTAVDLHGDMQVRGELQWIGA